jgi:hypothetical protein
MTPEERKLCRDLIVTPPRGAMQISKEAFLRQFPSSVEQGKLVLRLLEDACTAQNAEDLGCALIVGHAFSFRPEHTDILCRLVEADWHISHEDVVGALEGLQTPDAVGALFRATQWIPEHLHFDESRALAVKAIWALGKIPGAETEKKLEMLTRSDDAILRENATEQLARRREAIIRGKSL